jgi:hypothetical protein
VWYRLGKKGHPSLIIEGLERPNRTSDIRREMAIVSGWQPSFAGDEAALKRQLRSWLGKHRDEFKAGVLYKYGYPQELAKLQ